MACIGYDGYQMYKNPSWENAAYLGWSVGATFIPFVPGSYAGRGAKYAYKAGKAGSRVKKGRVVKKVAGKTLNRYRRSIPANKNQSTGRTKARNLKEQLAMKQARSNPKAGKVLTKIKMNDRRWPASKGWVKMRQKINGINIHYVRNKKTGRVADYKFKN